MGFLEVGNGGTILFSIIGNNPKLTVAQQRAKIDEVVQTLHRDAIAGQRVAADATVAVLRQKDVMAKFNAATFALP